MSRRLGQLAVLLLVFAAVVLITSSFEAQARDAPARVCDGGQIKTSEDSAVVILKEHDISCSTVTKLGRSVLSNTPHPRLYGFTCKYLNVKAGGGESRCTKGPSLVLFGFE